MDVGAGTTNATWLHISDTKSKGIRVKDRLSFYAAECEPPACDALNQVLSTQIDGSTFQDTRGRENELVGRLDSAGRTAYDNVLRSIANVLIKASVTAFSKEQKIANWMGLCQVFLHGGGTRLDLVRRVLIEAKKRWLIESDPVANPGLPDDLSEIDGSALREDVDLLLVAYGLARRLGDVVDAIFPVDVSEHKPEIKLACVPSHEIQYED